MSLRRFTMPRDDLRTGGDRSLPSLFLVCACPLLALEAPRSHLITALAIIRVGLAPCRWGHGAAVS